MIRPTIDRPLSVRAGALFILLSTLILLAACYASDKDGQRPVTAWELELFNSAGTRVADLHARLVETGDADAAIFLLEHRNFANDFRYLSAVGNRMRVTVHDNNFSANLQPGTNDNNITLTGTRQDKTFTATGEWDFSSFAGAARQGTFRFTAAPQK